MTDDADVSHLSSDAATADDTALDDGALPFGERARGRVEALDDTIDADAFEVSFGLFRAATRLIQQLDAEVHRPLGHSIAGFRILFVVWVHGELEQRDITRLSGVTRAAVSSTLTTLERDGLCERVRSAGDRRQVVVRLTPLGSERVELAYRRQNELEARWINHLDPAQIHATRAALEVLLRAPFDA